MTSEREKAWDAWSRRPYEYRALFQEAFDAGWDAGAAATRATETTEWAKALAMHFRIRSTDAKP
jgi:hypothetical protein